jgi:probable rRNA maturation factor
VAAAEDAAVASAIDVCADAGVAVPGGEAAIDRIGARLAAAATVLGAEIARLSVRLVDDATMRSLHDRHCGIDATTDVLTFAAAAPHEPVEADVACCVDEAARQAARRGHAVDDELLLYALHGLLHCLGHDDRDPAGFAAMHAEEDRVLAAIGAAARFASPDREDSPADAAAGRNGAESLGVDR